METIIQYLKYHKKSMLLFLCFGGIFFTVFSLASYDLHYVLYAFLLCFFVAIIVVCWDYYRFYQRTKLLKGLKGNLTLRMKELPKPRNQIENLYQELLSQMEDELKHLRYEMDLNQTEMMNYYTLWVHQIKTPISALQLLLQSEDVKEKTRLENELFKIEQYVEMVLSYLRLGSDSTDYKIERYDLDGIVKQAIHKYAKLFIQKKLSLDYQQIQESVLTDEKWLLFVIEQILSNSLKYTKVGGISIYMEENQVLVIKDSGIGIASEDVPRVFENGFTGYNGRQEKKSTGLGLYLCKTIMKNLGHEIELTSEVAKGTKVKLKLSSERRMYE